LRVRIFRLQCLLALLLVSLLGTSAVHAQTDPPYTVRAKQISDVFSGKRPATEVFAQSFLNEVPASQIDDIAKQLSSQNGTVIGVERITNASSTTGTVDIGYQRGIVSMTMTIEDAPPHKIIGLFITGIKTRDDSTAKLDADFRALPGRTGVLVRRIDDPRVPPLLSINAGDSLAIGSAFKLWVLAEASRAISAGERRWSDTVPLGPKSLPSGMMQSWPTGTAVTLQTLATMMITISDNTATDTLLRTLGRPQVDAAVRMVGHSRPEITVPVLTTLEAFSLKMETSGQARNAYVTGNVAARRALLNAEQRRFTVDQIPLQKLVATPLYIDKIEWFASPLDLSKTLDWFRKFGTVDARAILAVNPGIAAGDAARFAYVGYKGGSENGVISMNLLLRTKAGAWYTVTASWNNTAAAVDDFRFVGLVTRAVALIP
jgi:beta-lactamase class A